MNMKKVMASIAALVVVVGAAGMLGGCKDKKAGKPEVVYFGAATCPFCQKATAFLNKLEEGKSYPEVKITRFDVSTKEGMDKFMEFREKCAIETTGVPLVVFKSEKPCVYEVGFGDDATTGEKYRQHIAALVQESKR